MDALQLGHDGLERLDVGGGLGQRLSLRQPGNTLHRFVDQRLEGLRQRAGLHRADNGPALGLTEGGTVVDAAVGDEVLGQALVAAGAAGADLHVQGTRPLALAATCGWLGAGAQGIPGDVQARALASATSTVPAAARLLHEPGVARRQAPQRTTGALTGTTAS
jgi:hypothetical protein